MSRDGVLSRVEASLGRYPGRRGRWVLERWEHRCCRLAQARLRAPDDLPRWLWSLGRDEADGVLRILVGEAQAGDAVAAAAVLACLRPGLCALAARTSLPVDEVLSEVAGGVLRFPLERRASVAGQLLLDARRTIGRRRRKEREVLDGDTRVALEEIEAPGELGVEVSAAEQVVGIVAAAWRAGKVNTDEARLILETRVAGASVAAAAARRGVKRTAAYQRRLRAEARLADTGLVARADRRSVVVSGRPRPLGERVPEEAP